MGFWKGRGEKKNAPPVPEPEQLTVESAVDTTLMTTHMGWAPATLGVMDCETGERSMEAGCSLLLKAKPRDSREFISYRFFIADKDIWALVHTAMRMHEYAYKGEWGKEPGNE